MAGKGAVTSSGFPNIPIIYLQFAIKSAALLSKQSSLSNEPNPYGVSMAPVTKILYLVSARLLPLVQAVPAVGYDKGSENKGSEKKS